MKIVIRDDDLCYYSRLSEFQKAYLGLDVPVSISLIPFGVSDHGNKHPYGLIRGEQAPINLNYELCEHLKVGLRQNKYEIMLHGFTHEYKISNNKLQPEMLWRDKKDCERLMHLSLDLFDKTFGIEPRVFVAPSDKVNKFIFSLLKKFKLNYCGLINNLRSRPFSFKTLTNYIRRWLSRVRYGYPFCGVMKYNGWKEIQAYQRIESDYLISVFEMNRKLGYPMVIETHYWELNSNSELRRNLINFINYAKNNCADFCLMSEIFK